MPYRLITVHVENEHLDRVHEIRETDTVIDSWKSVDGQKKACFWFVVHSEDVQEITDKLQPVICKGNEQTLTISALESVLPKPKIEKAEHQKKNNRSQFSHISREELYEDVSRSSQVSGTFAVLVILSTVVAAIGLLEDNIAVVIGAMVIAPLLGPNLALALATALGDRELAVRALKANGLGLSLCLLLSITIGYFWGGNVESEELLSRTAVKYDGIALAIASGAAAALSLTTGVSSVLVGVMVAVALLPPAATLGIMLGAGNASLATGALLLLTVNIVCVNLSAKVVFWVQKIRPRHWYQQKKAEKAMRVYVVIWLVTLGVLAGIIKLRQTVDTALESIL